jgi:excisionase family DNA binding protein
MTQRVPAGRRKAVEKQLFEVMTITEAAEYLRIAKDTLYKYASQGLVPAFKCGNRWRFKRTLLDAWVTKQCSGDL